MAGIAGVDPNPLTLRELAWMAEGRQGHDWEIAAHQMALLINLNRKPGSRPVKPADVNPYERGKLRATETPKKMSLKEAGPMLKSVLGIKC